jgi:hypothetical protein
MARKTAMAVLAAVLLGIVLPGVASAALPDLVSRQGTSREWTAYKLIGSGGSYDLTWTFPVERDPVWIGILFYNEDDTFRGGFHYSSFTYQNSYRAEVNVLPGQPVAVEETRDAYGYAQSVKISGPVPGTPEQPVVTKILVWVAGAVSGGWSWNLSATPGTELAKVWNEETEEWELVMTEGTSAFIHLSKEFPNTASAGAQATAPRVPDVVPNGIGPGARVTAGAQMTKTIQHAYVGTFAPLGQGSPFGAQANAMTVTDPSGFEKDCRIGCAFWEMKPPAALRAGPYTFRITGAGAGIGAFGDVLLTGVDAHLPA